MVVVCVVALLHGLALWAMQRGLQPLWFKPAEALLTMNVKLIVPSAPPPALPLVAQPAPQPVAPPIRKPAKPPKPVTQTALQAAPQPAPEAAPPQADEPVAAAAQSGAPAGPSAPAPVIGPAAGAPAALPSGEAQCLGNASLPYPAMSRRLGETGRVIVGVLIGADGQVHEVNLQRSSGYARLDAAALQTARRWRCQPVVQDGTPQAAWRNAPVDFILQ
ncbi:MAG: energy transducer TonB [Burkholderiaceae bacterium]|nr:energy transducer TonB [Burkholderiaceae bacterium]